MARSKAIKEEIQEEREEAESNSFVDNIVSEQGSKTENNAKEMFKDEINVEEKAQKSGPSYDELLSLVQSLANEVQSLKQQKNTVAFVPSESSTTERILDMLSNRKADKEVVIVHNREMMSGLSTHIELTGLTIDFHSMGEERILSWQQFEECVSKYKSFFEREIILVSDEYDEEAQRYSVPCVHRKNGKALTSVDLKRLPKMSGRDLEEYFGSLNEKDRDFLFSYWLGKAYIKTEGFYDRYKIETLNRFSKDRVFDNLLTLMNGDYRLEDDNNSK